jgi:radical SAM/Cys-rich protein
MQLPEGTGTLPEKFIPSFVSFQKTLSRYGIRLERGRTTTMQVNVGLLCNQTCRHCHLEAGPRRTELMDKKVLDEVVVFAERGRFETIDITGGAPELNPHLVSIIEGLAPLVHNFMVRTNLSALEKVDTNRLISVFRNHGVVLVASFPSLNQSQIDSQRGTNVFQTSISMLRRLNAVGYGLEGTGLELNLVSNPTGAFLPASQLQTEMRFRQVLEKKWGIFFNQIFNFANVPLGRFRQWLLQSGNFETYIQKLVSTFNPCAIEAEGLSQSPGKDIFMIVILI